MRSGPTRLTVRPLSVRVTGEIRTRDLFSSHWSALSTELQRHAGVNLLTLERERGGGNFGVDKYHQCIKCYSFVTKSWECK